MAISLRMIAAPTDEDLLELSRRNPGFEFERSAEGELIVTPTGTRSGLREGELFAQLHAWARADGRGLAFGASTGFRMPDGAVFAPDAAWVRRDRWDALAPEAQEGFAPRCPDAVFEVASPSNRSDALRAKLAAYLANGAQLAVLIDSIGRVVEIHAPGQSPRVVEQPRSVVFSTVLTGFELRLEPIFA
ncbi:MAG: Uma2 family endonuclease [Armatimonadota bacterium]|nr:Uma2 family endonuclease [Armatimonadota bacterium]MDR7510572.1 Uma2 family endonuclease [Armatimonadota bacterium]